MEEKNKENVVDLKTKIKTSKAVEDKKTEPAKMTYEQLENLAHQLSDQSRQLYNKLQESNMINMFKRMDYLFKVIENSNAFSDDFVDSCTSEIESMMTVDDSNKDNDTDTSDGDNSSEEKELE